jgi:hypothetical protein
MVPFDDRWDDFFDLFPTDDVLARMTDAQMSRRFGMQKAFFQDIMPSAIRMWRVSPSRSLINAIGTIDGNSVPSGDMFRDIKDQTRILAAAVLSEALQMKDVRSVKGPDGKTLRVSQDAMAVTLADEGVTRINEVARFLKAWEMRNLAKLAVGVVKMPKVLYRGIRGRTVDVPELKGMADEKWNFRHCRLHEMQRDALLSRPLSEVSGTPILSFTSSLDIARTFSFSEGHVVEIDPASCSIMAGWATDADLAGKDHVLGKHEREWIVRLDPSFIPSPEQLSSRDRTLAFSTNDQAGIEMLHHYTEARYQLEGRKVDAWFRYNANGRGGRIVYRVNDEGWGVGPNTIKKELGFDPIPGPDRKAENLVFTHKSFPGAKAERFHTYEPQDTKDVGRRRASGRRAG